MQKVKSKISKAELAKIHATLALIQTNNLFDAVPILYNFSGAKGDVPSLRTMIAQLASFESVVVPFKHNSLPKHTSRTKLYPINKHYSNGYKRVGRAVNIAKALNANARYIIRSVEDGFRVWRVA